MAVCKYCGKEMLVHCSCLPKLIINGKTVSRIRYGEEKRFGKYDKPKGTCNDCACKLGEYHHFGCDIEENPITGKQLLADILDEEEDIAPSK